MSPNSNISPPVGLEDAGAALGLAGRRTTGRLIKAALWGGAIWFAYQLANQIASRNTFQNSPATTIAFLALSLALAAYVAMRQQAQLAEQTRAHCLPRWGAEMEKAVEEASDAIVITDANGTVQYVNPAYTRMTGYSAEEVIGRNPRQEKSGLGPAFHNQVRDSLLAGKVWRGEVANLRKDGTPYVEEISVAPVRDANGTIKRCIAIRRDVTARKSAEESKEFFASIVESSEDAILSSTPEGMIVSWNRGAERLYGYRAEEAVGKPVSLVAPEDQRASLKWISERLQRGESVGQFEAVGLTKDGTRVHISISAWPILDASGRIAARAAIMRDITARVQAQEAKALLASIVDSAEDAIFGVAADGAILSWNQGAEAIYGYRTDEILGTPVSILFASERINETTVALDKVGRGETISQWETVTVKRKGGPVDVSLTISPVRNGAGRVVGASIIARDISRRLRDREALQQSEENYRSLVASLPDVVWVTDEAGQGVFVSPNCREITGFTPEEICRQGFWTNRVHPDDLPRVEAAYRALFEEGRAIDAEYRFLRRDGQWIWLHSRAVNTYERDGKRYRNGLLSDITARKRMEQKLAYQATHDLLTGLANRAVFEDRLGQTLARARRKGGMAALLYVDLDRFQRINETLGHLAGDSLIQFAAGRLAGCLRESETLSRSGGDRFMLILEIGEPRDAAQVADRVLETLSAPFVVKGNEVFLSASIGIAVYPRDGEDLAGLQRAADGALYAAKRQGKRRVQMSTPELSRAASRRLAVETELHYALERGELSLHYQPQFDLASNRVAGLEALVRWHNPKFGQVPASVLIPIAEESGLIVPIGAYVLREACRQGRSWRDAGYGPMHVAVNTSAVQFARGGWAQTVSDTLAETGLEPQGLDVEVTESVIMQDIQESARQLKQLKELGVSVSLDDFGTGYSSLSYLEALPIDNLKIDRKFVQRMHGSDNSSRLVESIVGLAHSMGMRAVAEGVETGEQLAQLRAMGCDRAQSFMLGGPAPALSIQALLEAGG